MSVPCSSSCLRAEGSSRNACFSASSAAPRRPRLARRNATAQSAPPDDQKNQSHSAPQPALHASRRDAVLAMSAAVSALVLPLAPASAVVEGFSPMSALKGKDYGKSRMTYSDYVTTASGLQYQDLVPGKGECPQRGQTAVIDWDGYTIGYYGRPFEARNKTKGGSFTGDDKEFLRFVVGSATVIPAIEEAILGMKIGGIRRIIVPEELGYPKNSFDVTGPRPSNFSGRRALDFVLKNQGMIDKTLLFDLELMAIK